MTKGKTLALMLFVVLCSLLALQFIMSLNLMTANLYIEQTVYTMNVLSMLSIVYEILTICLLGVIVFKMIQD